MKAYEKDTEVKIPNWYLKLPQKMINRLSDLGLAINRILPSPKRKHSKKNIHGKKCKILFVDDI